MDESMYDDTMPQEYRYQDGNRITEAGLNLIARLMATQQPLVFTRATVGDGMLAEGVVPEEMTGLVHEVTEGMIAGYDTPAGGQMSVKMQVSSIGVEEAFRVTELGLWAQDPEGGEILYSYSTYNERPEWISSQYAAVSKLATFTLITIVSNIPNVTAVIHPDALVTVEMLEKYALKIHVHRIADVIGLQEILDSLMRRMELLEDLISGEMTGGITFSADFWDLTNVTVIEGVLDRANRLIWA